MVQEGRLDLRAIFAQELNHRAQLLLHVGKVDEEAAATVQTAADLHTQLVEDEGRLDLYEHLSRSLLLRGRVWQRNGKWEAAKQDYASACRYLSMLPAPRPPDCGAELATPWWRPGSTWPVSTSQLGDYESAVSQAETTLALLEGEVSASSPDPREKSSLTRSAGSLSSIRQPGHQPSDQEAALGAHDSAVELPASWSTCRVSITCYPGWPKPIWVEPGLAGN